MIPTCPDSPANMVLAPLGAAAVLRSQLTELVVRLGAQGGQDVAQLVKGVRLLVVRLDPRSDHASAQSGDSTQRMDGNGQRDGRADRVRNAGLLQLAGHLVRRHCASR